ncbi:MAG: enoyl-CoA hydratase/isomerase family protein [Myxococcota bacterium]
MRSWVATLPRGEGRVRVDGDEIVVDHPPTKNALTPHMMVDLADAVDAVRGARVVILRGEGGAFCSGGNLGVVREHMVAPGGGARLATFMHSVMDALDRLDAIVIAAVEGAALGGGAELVAACDFVHATPDAKIGFVQARLGVSPGFGGGARLVRRVGPRAALQALAEARALTGEEARAIGLVDVVEADPVAGARARAERLRELDAAALAGAKRVVRAATGLPWAEALAVEREVFASLWGGPGHLEALKR